MRRVISVLVLLSFMGVMHTHAAGAHHGAPSTRYWYNLCGDGAETNNTWYNSSGRNYRWAGSISDCGYWGTGGGCDVVYQAGIFEAMETWYSDQVAVCNGDVNDWNHGNVVARSRCRFVDQPGGAFYIYMNINCNYMRHT